MLWVGDQAGPTRRKATEPLAEPGPAEQVLAHLAAALKPSQTRIHEIEEFEHQERRCRLTP